MLKDFDFYQFAGILMPGAISIVGFILLNNPDSTIKNLISLQLSIGDFGLFLIIAYALGHVIQAIGNWLECLWWLIRRGLPTTQVGVCNNGVITGEQRAKLLNHVRAKFSLDFDDTGKPLNEKEWHIVVRRMYAHVKEAGQAERIDLFNGIYGLSRGLATAFIIIAVASFFMWGLERWFISIFLSMLAILSIYRMDRFGRHYARELFVQYLNLIRKQDEHTAIKE